MGVGWKVHCLVVVEVDREARGVLGTPCGGKLGQCFDMDGKHSTTWRGMHDFRAPSSRMGLGNPEVWQDIGPLHQHPV